MAEHAEVSPAIVLEDIGKHYRAQRVLEGARLVVRAGEQIAIVGRSGSGKSTLLRLVGGLELPDSGRVLVDGHDLATLDEPGLAALRREKLSFVFQFFNLIATLTVAENVELPLSLNGVSKAASRRRSLELLAELGLADGAGRFPDELSGGEQQRVAIARAVVHEPRIVLADEPTGNLDAETADQVLSMLCGTCRTRGATLLIATHSREAAALADRVLAIRDGRVIEGRA